MIYATQLNKKLMKHDRFPYQYCVSLNNELEQTFNV